MIPRLAQEKDVAALALLAAQTFTQTWRDLVPAEDSAAYIATTFTPETLRADISRPAVSYLVLEASGALIGYARLSCNQIPPPTLELLKPALLDRFYLQSAWHGTGTAQALLKSVFERAQEQGAKTLWLCHHPSNERAGRFYVRQGFQNTGVGLPFTLAEHVYHDVVLTRSIV